MPDKHQTPNPAGRDRQCWNCGAYMGWIADRNYERRDTCGDLKCEREARDADREDREEAYRDLDDRMGW